MSPSSSSSYATCVLCNQHVCKRLPHKIYNVLFICLSMTATHSDDHPVRLRLAVATIFTPFKLSESILMLLYFVKKSFYVNFYIHSVSVSRLKFGHKLL